MAESIVFIVENAVKPKKKLFGKKVKPSRIIKGIPDQFQIDARK